MYSKDGWQIDFSGEKRSQSIVGAERCKSISPCDTFKNMMKIWFRVSIHVRLKDTTNNSETK